MDPNHLDVWNGGRGLERRGTRGREGGGEWKEEEGKGGEEEEIVVLKSHRSDGCRQ